jgi:hypothetical protein
MEATLKGPYGQTNLEPTPYPYTIGRAPENLLIVNDPKVSSHHAQIRPEGQGYDIVDLGSSNGTFVNEQRLVPNVPRLLYTGDQVRVGDTVFVYEAGAMSQPFGESTVYGGFSQGSTPSYSPVVAMVRRKEDIRHILLHLHPHQYRYKRLAVVDSGSRSALLLEY